MKKKKLYKFINILKEEIDRMEDNATEEYNYLYEETQYLRMQNQFLDSQLQAARQIIKKYEAISKGDDFAIIKTSNDFTVIK